VFFAVAELLVQISADKMIKGSKMISMKRQYFVDKNLRKMWKICQIWLGPFSTRAPNKLFVLDVVYTKLYHISSA